MTELLFINYTFNMYSFQLNLLQENNLMKTTNTLIFITTCLPMNTYTQTNVTPTRSRGIEDQMQSMI